MSREDLLAEIQHEIWSHWMKYMFSICIENGEEGFVTIPKEKVNRWKRQLNTLYKDLSPDEKLSDVLVVREHKIEERLDNYQKESLLYCNEFNEFLKRS
jgi:hypothetical protein